MLFGKKFHFWKNKQKLCNQQSNSSGGFTSLLREYTRQISHILKFSPLPNSWSFVMLLRLYGHGIEMFSNVYSLILLRKAINNLENRENGNLSSLGLSSKINAI